MDFPALALCLFVLLCQAKGDVMEETLTVKTGTDLLLDVGKPVTLNENDEMFWNFNSKVNIVKLTHTYEKALNPSYAGRAKLFPQNQWLLLKNVQKTDSGEYRAVVSGDRDRVLAQYQVTVVDPVSDVKLEAIQCSSEWPNLVVTCRTLDGRLSKTSICDTKTCYHEGGEPAMKVDLKNGALTCHHSNQVSSTEDTKTIEDLCRIKKDEDPEESAHEDDEAQFFLFIFIAFPVVIFVVFLYRHKRQQGDVKEETLSVKTGTDLLLDVRTPVTLNENDKMLWKFKREVNIVKLNHKNETDLHSDYTGRAELFPQNQSLLLKNVQKTDSGEYRAVISGNKERVLVKYQVRVLDPVSDVKLEVILRSSDQLH